MQLSFKLNEFDGPLDLLLYLVSKHKMDIFDIEIVLLIDQYLEYMDSLSDEDLDTAGEFIDMSARLVYMKTVMLLPRNEKEKEEIKAELTGQLVEYKALKEAAGELKKINRMDDVFVSCGETINADRTYNGKHSVSELIRAYIAAVGKGQRNMPPSEKAFAPIVAKKFVSVSSRIIYILKRLYKNPRQPLNSFFQNRRAKSETVATFLAVLELIRARRISVSENDEDLIFNSSGRKV